jgi:hypothetical protein
MMHIIKKNYLGDIFAAQAAFCCKLVFFQTAEKNQLILCTNSFNDAWFTSRIPWHKIFHIIFFNAQTIPQRSNTFPQLLS